MNTQTDSTHLDHSDQRSIVLALVMKISILRFSALFKNNEIYVDYKQKNVYVRLVYKITIRTTNN